MTKWYIVSVSEVNTVVYKSLTDDTRFTTSVSQLVLSNHLNYRIYSCYYYLYYMIIYKVRTTGSLHLLLHLRNSLQQYTRPFTLFRKNRFIIEMTRLPSLSSIDSFLPHLPLRSSVSLILDVSENPTYTISGETPLLTFGGPNPDLMYHPVPLQIQVTQGHSRQYVQSEIGTLLRTTTFLKTLNFICLSFHV